MSGYGTVSFCPQAIRYVYGTQRSRSVYPDSMQYQRPAPGNVQGAAKLRESVTTEISKAVLAELAETGYARMSMDAVARRARVGKAAIYRRWRSKEAMVIDIVSRLAAQGSEITSSGSLRTDVLAFLRLTRAGLEHPSVARIVPDLASEAARNPHLARALLETITEPRRSRVTEVLQLAIARGELPATLDMDLALDFLAGPLAVRMLITRQPAGPG